MSSVIVVLLLLTFTNKCRSTDDLTFILSEEALNSKILMSYLPMLNKKFTQYQFRNDTKDSNGIQMEWDDIYFQIFKYRQAYLELDSNNQTIKFKVTNLSIITNIFGVRIKYGMVNCMADAQLLIKNWNFSFDIDLYSSNYQIYDNDTIDDMIDYQDCELQLSLNTDSVSLQQPNNDTFDYQFKNFMCDIMLNQEYITNAFNRYVYWILQQKLPYQITKSLQKTIEKFEKKTQDLKLRVKNEISTLIICYHNLSITENKQLVITSQFRSNDTINYDDYNDDDLYSISLTEYEVSPYSVDILIFFHVFVIIILFFVMIGLIWFIYCLYQKCKN